MSTTAWELKNSVTKAAIETEIKFQEKNEDARKYKIIPQFRVVRKVPLVVHTVPKRVVEGFLTSKFFLHSTNEQIMETVNGWIPHFEFPSNFMDKPLSSKQLAAIGEILGAKNIAFDRKVHRSLSKIKLAVQAGKSADEAEVVYKGKIAFGKDYIVVGSKRFPFAPGADYHRVKVGDQKLRVDVLRSLLEAGNLPSSTS